MTYIMVDVETDGPIPNDFSMVSFGAVVVEPTLSQSFYGKLRPISENWIPEALAVSGHSREETLDFTDPKSVMHEFDEWISSVAARRPRFISDNAGFDWSRGISPIGCLLEGVDPEQVEHLARSHLVQGCG